METSWPQDTMGIYVHIPFCIRKCSYCDFFSVTGADYYLRQDYALKLRQEIMNCPDSYRDKPVDSIYFGGGTPSLLTPKQIGSMVEGMAQQFHFSRDIEITMEANPATVDHRSLAEYHQAGVNRISLGVQSLNDRELAALGRIHTAAAARQAITAAQAVGFDNLNLDLIYGIPGQTISSWLGILAEALNYQPQHISMYLLQLDGEVPMVQAIARGEQVLPGEEESEAMYYEAIDYMQRRDVRPYEISNLALPGYSCRHNLRYWHFGEYLGFGAGAVSRLKSRRWMNAPDLKLYLSATRARSVLLEDMSVRKQAAEAAIMGLRLRSGLHLPLFKRRFGIDFMEMYQDQIEIFTQRGWLELEHGWLRLTKAGIMVSNRVLCEFVD